MNRGFTVPDTLIMVGPSTSCAFMELEQIQVWNEGLCDENIGEFSWMMIAFLTVIIHT
jgi:hypothetical protein